TPARGVGPFHTVDRMCLQCRQHRLGVARRGEREKQHRSCYERSVAAGSPTPHPDRRKRVESSTPLSDLPWSVVEFFANEHHSYSDATRFTRWLYAIASSHC